MPSESNGGGLWPIVASLCNQRGLDPNMVAAMMNNNRGNGFGGDSAWWIIILLIFGWGGFGGFGGGFGGRGTAQGLADLGNLVNNDAGRELIMQAVQMNGNAISQLASTVHCDVNALQGAIANLGTQLNGLGLGQQQIINALQSGDASIMSQLAQCCCDIRSEIAAFKGSTDLQICQQTNALTNSINFVNASVERGFAAEAYERQAQTNAITQAIANQTTFLSQKFCDLEMREMQRENQNLRDQLNGCRLAESQQAQNAFLLGRLQPTPVPAYPVGANYGFNYGWYNNGNNGCNCGCGY